MLLIVAALLLAAAGWSSSAHAGVDADKVFARFGPLVGQVRVVDRGSRSKAAIGSGFFVHRSGLFMTNFHVIAELVHHPDRYLAELVLEKDRTAPLELLNVDVVHDLAVLRTTEKVGSAFALAARTPHKGTRLFSLGNPLDLGASIVEGTYNGLLENSLYEKIHFTGAINPGMSGGPAITGSGQVVGINVATAGNEVGFLVPAAFAARLLARTTAPGYEPPEKFLDQVRQQLLDNQDAVVAKLLGDPFGDVTLGHYRVPGELRRFFKCWGDTVRRDDDPYEMIYHQCSTQDDIFIAQGHSAGSITFQHNLISSRELNPLRFFALYESQFTLSDPRTFASKEHVGAFACTTHFVEHAASTFKVVLCLRSYKHLAGLYDAVFKAASLDDNRSGLQTTLSMSGVTFENADRLARRYLEAIAWTN